MHSGKIDIDITGDNLKIIKNEKYLTKKKNLQKEKEIIDEKIKIINFNDINKDYFMKLNEQNLFIKDFKEIERKINEDKKKCQKCGCSLNGEEPRKGWKNELGEYTLLCNYCVKKYYDGAHEVRYDSHSIDNQINYNMNNQSYNSNFYNNMNNMKISNNYSQIRNNMGLGYSGYGNSSNLYRNNDGNYDPTRNNFGINLDANKPKFVSFQVQKNDNNK